MIWYIDRDFQSFVEPATAELERVRRREERRHIDEANMVRLRETGDRVPEGGLRLERRSRPGVKVMVCL
jgi:hypothetical protein